MASPEGNLPVPSSSRERNSRPAMVSGWGSGDMNGPMSYAEAGPISIILSLHLPMQ